MPACIVPRLVGVTGVVSSVAVYADVVAAAPDTR